MGNGAPVRQIIGGVSLLLVVVLASATYAFAGSMSAQMTKRLCDRQDKVGWRLSRPLIDPAKCGGEQPAAPTLTFTATPPAITAGATSTLVWSAQNASSCIASNGWNGAKGTSGSQAVTPSATTTYTLSCTGAGGTVSTSVTVAVNPAQQPQAPMLSFTADPASITQGASSTLTWDSTNASSCTASNGWSGSKALDGTESVAPTATTTYGLTCVGAGGTTTQSVTVNVVPSPLAPTLSFTVSTSTITQGATTTLTWDSANATGCTASGGWSGAKALDGSQEVSPSATTTYTLACIGAGGTATSSVIVNVTPFPQPTVMLTANPTFVLSGGTTTLTWTTTNATSCTAFLGWNGAKATTGVEVVTPTATTTYQLDCTGPGGLGSDDAVVNFATTSTSTPSAPTLTFTANPTTVHGSSTSQATTTLTWNSSNANTCIASGGWSGSKALDGSETFEPTATTTYVLDCMGLGGSVQATTTVNFVASTSATQLDHVIISEVYDQPDASHGTDTANEWIELYNPTNAAVDLSFWSIKDATTNFDVIPQGTSIPAGGFLILTNASTTPSFWSIPGGVQVIAFESALGSGLNNSDETLFLRNAATSTIDSLSWGENTDGFISGAGAVDVVPGHSLYRTVLTVDTDTSVDWADSASPTPGLAH